MVDVAAVKQITCYNGKEHWRYSRSQSCFEPKVFFRAFWLTMIVFSSVRLSPLKISISQCGSAHLQQ